MKLTFYIVFIFATIQMSAQIKFDAKVSDRHLKKVARAKDARARYSSYKKYYTKDSIKASEKAWRSYKTQHRDSLKQIGLWKEAKANRSKILNNRWDTYTRRAEDYHADISSFPAPRDSLDWALQELAREGNYKELQQVYGAYAQYDSSYLDQFKLDSMRVDRDVLMERFQMKERIESYLPEELAQETNTNVSKQIQAGAIDEFGNLQKIDRSGVKRFFNNISPEQFAKSQVSIQTLKKKYSSLPNLTKQEEGIKRESLKGTPWKKRVFLGGNFTIQSTNPFIMDSNIKIGYRLNKRLSSGVGLVLREQFQDELGSSITGDAHGYSLFMNYTVMSSYFLFMEYQIMMNQSLFQETKQPMKRQTAYLLGAGKEFALSAKVGVSVSFLYDFNFKNNDLNAHPLVMRLGYMIKF